MEIYGCWFDSLLLRDFLRAFIEMKRGDVGKDFEEKEQTSREGRREGRERRDKVDSLGQDPSRQISGTGPFLTDDPRRPLLFYSLP